MIVYSIIYIASAFLPEIFNNKRTVYPMPKPVPDLSFLNTFSETPYQQRFHRIIKKNGVFLTRHTLPFWKSRFSKWKGMERLALTGRQP